LLFKLGVIAKCQDSAPEIRSRPKTTPRENSAIENARIILANFKKGILWKWHFRIPWCIYFHAWSGKSRCPGARFLSSGLPTRCLILKFVARGVKWANFGVDFNESRHTERVRARGVFAFKKL
jgi:hypothetical protein